MVYSIIAFSNYDFTSVRAFGLTLENLSSKPHSFNLSTSKCAPTTFSSMLFIRRMGSIFSFFLYAYYLFLYGRTHLILTLSTYALRWIFNVPFQYTLRILYGPSVGEEILDWFLLLYAGVTNKIRSPALYT